MFVHGVYPGSPDNFSAQQPLSDTFRLVVVDRSGYRSNPDTGGPLGWPADSGAAPVDYDVLAAAAFPKVLVVGGQPPSTAPGGERHAGLGSA